MFRQICRRLTVGISKCDFPGQSRSVLSARANSSTTFGPSNNTKSRPVEALSSLIGGEVPFAKLAMAGGLPTLPNAREEKSGPQRTVCQQNCQQEVVTECVKVMAEQA